MGDPLQEADRSVSKGNEVPEKVSLGKSKGAKTSLQKWTNGGERTHTANSVGV
jgi:hypothetical protein